MKILSIRTDNNCIWFGNEQIYPACVSQHHNSIKNPSTHYPGSGLMYGAHCQASTKWPINIMDICVCYYGIHCMSCHMHVNRRAMLSLTLSTAHSSQALHCAIISIHNECCYCCSLFHPLTNNHAKGFGFC